MIGKLNKSCEPDIKNASRVIAVGDIHGQYELLKDMVENQIQFNSDSDILIFLGDYIDRGQSIEDELNVLNYLIDLYNSNPGKIVLLRGNHEQMALETINIQDDISKMSLWKRNGCNLCSIEEERFKTKLCDFCSSLPLYLEDEWVFVHAGTAMSVPLEKQTINTLLWERSSNQYGYFGKRLIVGHTIHRTIQKSELVISVDTGAFRYGRLSAYDVKNDTEYAALSRTKSDIMESLSNSMPVV